MRSLKALFDARNEVPRHIQVRYSKGLHNYGSHLVNLLQYFFGSVRTVTGNLASSAEDNPDPSLSFVLEMASGAQVVASGVNDLDYEFLDLSIFYRDSAYQLDLGGFQVQKFIPSAHPVFPGYIILQPAGNIFPDGPVHGLFPAYQEIWQIAEGGRNAATNSADSAVETHRVLEAIRSSAIAQKRVQL
jgi:predicted dehydrogenase